LPVRRDVDRVLDREPIGGTNAIGAGVGVASHNAVLFGDQVGETFAQDIGAPVRHFRNVRRIVFETRGASADGMRVDGGDGRKIRVEAVTNDQGHALALLRRGTFSNPDVFPHGPARWHGSRA
jgi:hypothetical protein